MMRRDRQQGWVCWSAVLVLWLLAAAVWGYYFDDRREMSLSGFAYSRATIALQEGLAAQKHLYSAGNLVQHRNFLTLEWRHELKRASRDFPTVGPLFHFLNLGSFDYYLNLRTQYDGVWDYGPHSMRRMMKGTRLHQAYFDDARTAVPFDGLYFTPAARGGGARLSGGYHLAVKSAVAAQLAGRTGAAV